MADTASATRTRRSSIDRNRLYPLDEAVDARARDVQRQVRRLGGGPPPPRRRPPPRRPDGPRHRRPAARHRQGRPRRRLRPGREGPGGAARRRRRGRRRGPGQEDRGRLARVRRRARRRPTSMGHGRPARPDPRPPRPDAEPQVRHDHVRPRPRHPRGQVAAASSSRSTRARSSTSRSARRASSRTSWPRTWPALVDAVNRAKPSRRQGPVPADADRSPPRWAPASASTSRRVLAAAAGLIAAHRSGCSRRHARVTQRAAAQAQRPISQDRRIAADSLRPQDADRPERPDDARGLIRRTGPAADPRG